MKRILLYITLLSLSLPCDVSIRENFFNENIIGFYLSSIDLESGESSTLLFDYSIDLCGQDDELYVDFDIDMFVPSFSDDNIDLTDNSRVEEYSYVNCEDSTQVSHYKVIGGGHDWFGAWGNRDINSSELIWSFLSQFNLDGKIN